MDSGVEGVVRLIEDQTDFDEKRTCHGSLENCVLTGGPKVDISTEKNVIKSLQFRLAYLIINSHIYPDHLSASHYYSAAVLIHHFANLISRQAQRYHPRDYSAEAKLQNHQALPVAAGPAFP